MSKSNITTKKKENQYHHLTEYDRTVIQTLINLKDENGKRLFNNYYIAIILVFIVLLYLENLEIENLIIL